MEHELWSPRGARRNRKRRGRGDASGRGSYSGRGMKGQKARTGGGVSPRFEGGQNPLIKRMPHLRGFTNIFRVEYASVNLERLAAFEPGTQVTPESLAQARIIKNTRRPVKILGGGELDRPLQVAAHKFSRSARQKIEAAGGGVREL